MAILRRRRAFILRRASPTAPLGLLALAGPAWAQGGPPSAPDGLDVSGSMRLRYETIDGQARPGFNASDDLLNLRTILSAQYKTGPVKLAAEVYDSRAWLADRRTPVSTNEVNTFELVQAYVAVDAANAFGDGTSLSLQGGRFLLNIGSRRLVAADDYRNTTNGYTGLRADITGKGGLRGTFLYVLPQVRLPDDLSSILDNKPRVDRESFDQVLWGGTVSRSKTIGNAMAELSFYHLGERDAPGRPSRDRSLDTVGGRIIRDPKAGAIDYEIEAIYQFGHVSSSLAATAPRLAVSASFFHADIGYSFTGGWKPRVSIEFDRASGDGPGSRYGRFDTLFGMRRADLAPAGLYNAVGRANIATPGLRVEATPSKAVDWFVGYRLMWLADRTDTFSTTGVRDATGRAGSFAGHQVDARVRTWIVPDRLRVEVDGVWLAKGRFLRAAPNAPTNGDTKYLSLNLTASF
ncbi:alginate export family protein [Sphingomonas sp. JC676]|uniref:alginate export family protein n=1 Tax=Sphingomonas sp. JC676 TaxID=2768065 RepID=UPI00165839BF|nr:alginate export family protein [Sphingomonas sp. JC676]MBC9032839.1 alginate export family protein [Sphingomonas sp. JC676]